MIWVLVGYMALIFAIGIWANKFNNDMTDFLLAGRRLGLGLGAFALVATYFGGGFVIGLSELSYEIGLSSWWNGLGGGVGLILVGLMARKMRGFSFFTVPDYIKHRYGGNTLGFISSILSLVALIGILAAQVGAASSVLEMFGIGSMKAAVLASVVFVVFTAIGGLWAATITDFVQVIIAGVGVIVAGFLVLNKAGGWNNIQVTLQEKPDIAEGFTNIMGSGNLTFLVWLSLPLILYTLIGQDVYQRIFATKDEKTARNSAVVAGIVIALLTIFPVMIGMGAQVIYPDLTSGKLAFPTIVTELFPPLLAGLVLAAVMAAIVSTATSILTAGTSHIINDIYMEKFKNKNEKHLLKHSRMWTLIIGAIAIIVAAMFPKIVELLLISYTLYTAGVFVPVVGGFFWKGATLQGAAASMFAGLSIAIIGIAGVNLFGVPIEVLSSVIALIVFVIVSLLTQKKAV